MAEGVRGFGWLLALGCWLLAGDIGAIGAIRVLVSLANSQQLKANS